MSDQNNKNTELLIFGYINQNSQTFIPSPVILVINSFYDAYIMDFNWSIKYDEMQKFLDAKNGTRLESESFKLKGMTFQCILFPNGMTANDLDRIQFAICFKYIPKNIEFLGCYIQFKCETLQCVKKRFYKISQSQSGEGAYMMRLSQCKQLKQIDFHCLIDIKYIKYKNDSDIINDIKPLKIQKYIEYTWNINKSLMNQYKLLKPDESAFSPNFDHNNWCCTLIPNGSAKKTGVAILGIMFFSLPFGIKSVDIKFKISITGDINADYNERTETISLPYCAYNWFQETFTFSEFKTKESMSIHIKLEITKLCDVNDQMVERNEWVKYSIV